MERMLTDVPPSDCMSARETASARLDGEASELDVARLDAHLSGCAECRIYAAEIGSIAVGLRAAALELPATAIVLPQRRRLSLFTAAAAASFVVAATGSAFALGHVIGAHSPGGGGQVALGTTDFVGLRQDTAHQHLLALLNAFELRRQDLARMRAI
jgi:predicted anti-sigma-YlaC factor YlaD